MNSNSLLVNIIGLISLVVSNLASATSPTVSDHAIPASACEPYTTSAEKIQLTTRGWYFKAGQTGYAYLICPLNLSAYAGISGVNNDVSYVRTYYCDPDGAGTAAHVYTRLYSVSWNGALTYKPSFYSNSGDATCPTIGVRSVATDLDWDSLNSVLVRMYRANTTQNPWFTGIDFVTPLI